MAERCSAIAKGTYLARTPRATMSEAVLDAVCRRPPPSLSPHDTIQIYSNFRRILPASNNLLLPNAYR